MSPLSPSSILAVVAVLETPFVDTVEAGVAGAPSKLRLLSLLFMINMFRRCDFREHPPGLVRLRFDVLGRNQGKACTITRFCIFLMYPKSHGRRGIAQVSARRGPRRAHKEPKVTLAALLTPNTPLHVHMFRSPVVGGRKV